ncbi:hypothetical protein LTR85_009273 [Meristemomyces frigidus]|nr:hypothetical protein LTR85_009273 [Meristemomyces frigidus]
MDPPQLLRELHADLHLHPDAFDSFKTLVQPFTIGRYGPDWRAKSPRGQWLAEHALEFLETFGAALWPFAAEKRGHLTNVSRRSQKGYWLWNTKTAGFEGPVLLVDGRMLETLQLVRPRTARRLAQVLIEYMQALMRCSVDALEGTADELLSAILGCAGGAVRHELPQNGPGTHISVDVGDVADTSHSTIDAPHSTPERNKRPRATGIYQCPLCEKVFTRQCDLTKHTNTHVRPRECTQAGCKYEEYGFPTEKQRDRHVNDKHSAVPVLHHCLFTPCPYNSKRESNCKQHMEKAHGWAYARSKGNEGGSADAAATVRNEMEELEEALLAATNQDRFLAWFKEATGGMGGLPILRKGEIEMMVGGQAEAVH